MILGYEEIVEKIDKEKLLEDVEMSSVGGAGVDLRLGAVYRAKSEGTLGKEERVLPEIEEMADQKFILKPNEYVLIETVEKVNMPDELMARLLPRSSLFRMGGSLRYAVVDPGYSGKLTIGLKNDGHYNLVLEKGARVCQIVFEKVSGSTKPYVGRYQGGKVV
ncbi:dCTP deaminase [Candidatus Undinarchaeota archaeon]